MYYSFKFQSIIRLLRKRSRPSILLERVHIIETIYLKNKYISMCKLNVMLCIICIIFKFILNANSEIYNDVFARTCRT